MLVGHTMIDSRTLFDLNYTEFLNDRMNKDLQNKKLVHEYDFVSVKITEGRNCYIKCLTSDAYFCQSCGKTINNDQRKISCGINFNVVTASYTGAMR